MSRRRVGFLLELLVLVDGVCSKLSAISVVLSLYRSC